MSADAPPPELLEEIVDRSGLDEADVMAALRSLGPINEQSWRTAAEGLLRYMDLHGDDIPRWAEGAIERASV